MPTKEKYLILEKKRVCLSIDDNPVLGPLPIKTVAQIWGNANNQSRKETTQEQTLQQRSCSRLVTSSTDSGTVFKADLRRASEIVWSGTGALGLVVLHHALCTKGGQGSYQEDIFMCA
eukprot:602878-Amphidinium_carterae.2